MKDIQFANPEFLYALIIIPLLMIWYIIKNNKQNPALYISDLSPFTNMKKTLRQRLRHILFLLRISIMALVIIAIARPQSSSSKKNITTEGIDIVLAIDVSSSMLAEDLKPNRIKAAKKNSYEIYR